MTSTADISPVNAAQAIMLILRDEFRLEPVVLDAPDDATVSVALSRSAA